MPNKAITEMHVGVIDHTQDFVVQLQKELQDARHVRKECHSLA